MLSRQLIQEFKKQIELSPFAEIYVQEEWFKDDSLLTEQIYNAVIQRLEKDRLFIQREIHEITETFPEVASEIYGIIRQGDQEVLLADEQKSKESEDNPEQLFNNAHIWEK